MKRVILALALSVVIAGIVGVALRRGRLQAAVGGRDKRPFDGSIGHTSPVIHRDEIEDEYE